MSNGQWTVFLLLLLLLAMEALRNPTVGNFLKQFPLNPFKWGVNSTSSQTGQ